MSGVLGGVGLVAFVVAGASRASVRLGGDSKCNGAGLGAFGLVPLQLVPSDLVTSDSVASGFAAFGLGCAGWCCPLRWWLVWWCRA